MKRLIICAIATLFLSGPIAALDISAMNDTERQVFRQEIRAYLLENPEVLMEAIAVLEQRQQQAQTTDDNSLVATNAQALFDDQHSYRGGNPDGDVTVVEFLDYRCGYCKRAHPEVTELINSDGNIRYIVKELPILGEQSVLASRFAISVLQNVSPEAYAKVHDALMSFRGDISNASLKRLAKSLDLEPGVIMAAMDSDAVNAVIAENRLLAQRMQISGTPSFVMGAQMVRGYVPLDGMREIVASARSK
ncbi:MAG: DsbA family protein [Marinosulfonomonas sp.]|nr:DsbA family protein [Marinosulfonomonas sp.]